MLKSPKLGRKNDTIARILLTEPKVPHKRIRIIDVNGTKFFLIFIVLRWRVKQLFRVIAIDSPRTIKGSMLKPMKESFSKIVSNPPVVLVFVTVYRSRII